MSDSQRQTQPTRRVLDNRGAAAVGDYLRERLRGAESLRLVSAYFSIYGYELLADALDPLRETRFLFGDPSSIDNPDPGGKPPKSFVLDERALVPGHALRRKWLAQRCAEWVERDSVGVRSVRRTNFLHGKMYLADSPAGAAGLVGSSNFTKRGLGGGGAANLEINVALSDGELLAELRRWFDALWSDGALTEDVKQEVLDALNRAGRDYAPEFVYFKTLYELFKNALEAQEDSDRRMRESHLHDSAVWNKLYEFQKHGAQSVIARLQQHGGCILADSVGLGKTYTALAVVKHYELRNERVLVLCPKKLYENWALYPAANARGGNPFLDDKFGYTLLAHTDLSRDAGMSGSVDLADIHWDTFDLVVIDESHNFRNADGKRYEKLMQDVLQSGARTKVLMLSATPVNTALTDLGNQIRLITQGDDRSMRESLGVAPVVGVIASAQKEFKQWESEGAGRRDKAKLLENLGPEFFRLLGGVSISRSRRQIERFYAQEMDRIGSFPKRDAPQTEYPDTDANGELSYEEVANRIGAFDLSVYRPSDYLLDASHIRRDERAPNFTQQDRERYLVSMMRVNFLKRLESSAHSLALTLQRTIDKMDALLDRIARYERSAAASALADVLPDDDEEDEDFLVNRARRPYRLAELDLPRWTDDVRRDRDTLAAALESVAAVTPERDGKLIKIREEIRRKADNPPLDSDGRPNRKLLVFTTFKDTANYLYGHLRQFAEDLGLRIAMVSGDETHAAHGPNNFNAILTNFAPRARNRSSGSADPEIDLLIATDCISEGQNLQDCDAVLNYDIHWNPVRLIQRFGRIDRIGSRNASVRMVNYWPTKNLEAYLRLETRVTARMALADAAASGSDDPLARAAVPQEAQETAQLELNFRDQQLLAFRDSVPEFDDLDDNLAMSDFTMDSFLAQLRQYLERNKAELEAAPPGVYAVAPPKPAAGADPGALFLLRQTNARDAGPDPRKRAASPLHPFSLVYVKDDGAIRYGCASARQALALFEQAAAGYTEPIARLCDWFDRETERGARMERSNNLVNAALAHIRQAHGDVQSAGLERGGRDFALPTTAESPGDASEFELVTWLIIAPSQP